jgi:tetrahydromethanopterin S-methyltransferase subunit A
MIGLKNKLNYFAGEVCKILFPINIDSFKGCGSSISLCTLSSIELLIKISKLSIMDNLIIAGRLYSENKGIDQLISYCVSDHRLKYVILCGKDTRGHYPGDALIKLTEHGIDADGKILGTIAPSPFLCSHKDDIDIFKKQVSIIDMRDCFDVDKISEMVYMLSS